eukprot:TRINITY_DN926_c0_g1_i1.p1 TRINITY_DN926_c0_g1~~TRINITY_DN926_c0_g1_i1.p1  ORF type:complete len:151 (-),score=47.89 TRINITY_DN926_c0_g1_i1:238-690(-)
MVCWDAEKGTCTRPNCKWCAGATGPSKGKGKGKGKSSGGDLFAQFMQFMMGGGGGKGGGKYEQEWKMQGKYKLDESGGVLGEYTGTLKSFSYKNGYGFIDSPEIKAMGYQDVFMHGDMKKGYKPGQQVKFTAFLTGGGQVQCKDLKSGLK